MHWILRFYSSSVGKKIVMAATGVILFGFIIGHLIGNLQIFAGPEVLDSYARFLKEKPEVIWTARVTLLASVGLHILAATQLTIRNRSARPMAYRLHKYDEASYAARTMAWSGPIIGLFIIYHLLHFTVGTVHPSQPDFRAEAVHVNVVSGFQQWPVALFYIVAVLSLGLHIAHGVWSMFQSIGLNHPKYEPLIHRSAVILSCLIVAGYVSTPSLYLSESSVKWNFVRTPPSGPIERKWEARRSRLKLVNPANKRKYNVIVVGSGLAGAAAAASLAELGYNIQCFCYQDSPRTLRQPLRYVQTYHGRRSRPGADAHLPRRPLRDGRALGGLWVDYNLMSTIPGLFVLGEANFSDHGANRLGASALMQGLADGYFIIPYTIGHYLASSAPNSVEPDHEGFGRVEREVAERTRKLLAIDGKRTVDKFHRKLGKLMWDFCGMSRDRQGLTEALEKIPALRQEFWEDVRVLDTNEELNPSLEKAGRVADFLELAELMCRDALERDESCGSHFRIEHQTPDGEALRNDEDFSYVAAWEYKGRNQASVQHREPLNFEFVTSTQRSYK